MSDSFCQERVKMHLSKILILLNHLAENSIENWELNYHDQKIRQTLMHDIRKHWTTVLTLLGLISSIYHDFSHWRSNQQPQIAVPKLYSGATSSYRPQVMPN